MQLISKNTKRQVCAMLFSNPIKQLYTKAGSADTYKAELVEEFTAGRTNVMGEMYEAEAIELHRYLKGLMPAIRSTERVADVLDKKRKAVIGPLKEAGWIKPGTTKADIGRIEEWCAHTLKKPFKVRLNDLTGAELSICIEAAKKVKKHTLIKVYGAGN